MGYVSPAFKEEITDAMKCYTPFTKPVKSSLLKRLLVISAPVTSLHPNPEDEFTDPNIGPDEEIVNDYAKKISYSRSMLNPLPMKPLIVERISTGGYMILNGHHRWLAAKRQGVKKLPIMIVNATHEDDVLNRMKELENSMCVSFDLDEVLLCPDASVPLDHLSFPRNLLYKWPVRKDAGSLLSELRRLGFDVWVYTGNYKAPELIQKTLKAHGGMADGIISGMNLAKSNTTLKTAFTQKYNTILHVDSERILWVHPATKEFDSLELSRDADWANDAISKIQKKLSEEKSNS
ncbi:MAG: ParB N-terminal domain-containing protein [Clostridia bacterium]|jgi:hypothetical protein|nr:ParB N-terminal domain-containing protein [Clostridia bacterium]